MRGVLMEGKTAGCQRSDTAGVSGKSNLESSDDEQRARNRHQVLEHRAEGAWALGNQEWMGELFEWEGSTIWGLTGRILADLLPRFREALDSPPPGGGVPAKPGWG